MRFRPFVIAFAVASVCPAVGRGQTSSVPQFDSRPGAAYTLYLNFGGFNYTGTWGGSGQSPGVVPAYDTDGTTTSFSTAEIANIKTIWSRAAEKYAAFNINVTTTDPAPAGSTDPVRQLYYETAPRVMQTIIGGSNAWYSTAAGGVSYLGVAYNGGTPSGNGGVGAGYKTNWVFSALSPTDLQFVAEAAAHENGHALGLSHQSRWTGSTLNDQYDGGTGTGTGSVAPIMGNSYSAQRGTWRVGATNINNSVTAQNDAARLLTNNGIAGNGAGGFMDSGVGHTPATATPLPHAGVTVTSGAAAGLIAPNSAAATPLGEANYTTDYFTLTTYAGPLNITLRSGRSTVTAGTADAGATLNATMRLLAADGVTVVASSSSGVLSETITLANLPAGTYYLQIASAGGGTDNGYSYFDMGSYFLTGTYTPTPEPGFVLAVGAFAVVAARRWRRRTTEDHACPSKS